MRNIIYKRYIKKRLNYIIWLLFVIVLGIVLGNINPYLFGRIIDNISVKDASAVKKTLICFSIVLLNVQVLSYVENIIGKKVVLKICNDIKSDLFFSVMNMPYYESDSYEQGELLNRIEFDASTIVEYYIDFISSVFLIVGNLFMSLYFLFNISKILSIVSLFLIFLMYVINFVFKEKVLKIQSSIKEFTDKYYGWLQESVANILGAKVFRLEKRLCERYNQLLNREFDLYMKSVFIDSNIEFLRGIISLCLDVAILFVASKFIINGTLTIGNLVAFNTYLSRLLIAISKILDINMNKQVVNISYSRIMSLLEKEEHGNQETEIVKITEICFEKVYFGYNDNLILKGVSFYLDEPGLYSIVGGNGCGKTTILSLIEKLYHCKKGNISINGNSVENINTESLRSNILYLTKVPYLINGTILENLRIGNENASRDEILNICKLVGIHEDIIELDKGYDSQVCEEGKNLSSGQKQKIVFVRAYISKASVVLLDEVTSDIDGKCEKEICELIKKMSEYSMIINISHRELSVKMSKKVFFLQNGEIIDDGTHEELLNKYKEYKDFFTKEQDV